MYRYQLKLMLKQPRLADRRRVRLGDSGVSRSLGRVQFPSLVLAWGWWKKSQAILVCLVALAGFSCQVFSWLGDSGGNLRDSIKMMIDKQGGID